MTLKFLIPYSYIFWHFFHINCRSLQESMVLFLIWYNNIRLIVLTLKCCFYWNVPPIFFILKVWFCFAFRMVVETIPYADSIVDNFSDSCIIHRKVVSLWVPLDSFWWFRLIFSRLILYILSLHEGLRESFSPWLIKYFWIAKS